MKMRRVLSAVATVLLVAGLTAGCKVDTGGGKHHFNASGNGSQHKHKAPKQHSGNGLTANQQSAVDSASQYLNSEPGFSRTGLIKQLKFEHFSTKDATFAVDHITVNWNQQAAISAKQYQKEEGGFSRGSMIQQLTFEGFTPQQAAYGATQVGLR